MSIDPEYTDNKLKIAIGIRIEDWESILDDTEQTRYSVDECSTAIKVLEEFYENVLSKISVSTEL